MKKLFLGFATMLSLLALVLGLCACGGDDPSDGGDESSKGASYSIQAPQTSDVFNVTGLPDSAYEGDTVTFRVVLAHPADSVLNYVEVCGTDMGSRRLDAVADGSYSFIMPAEPVQLTVDAEYYPDNETDNFLSWDDSNPVTVEKWQAAFEGDEYYDFSDDVLLNATVTAQPSQSPANFALTSHTETVFSLNPDVIPNDALSVVPGYRDGNQANRFAVHIDRSKVHAGTAKIVLVVENGHKFSDRAVLACTVTVTEPEPLEQVQTWTETVVFDISAIQNDEHTERMSFVFEDLDYRDDMYLRQTQMFDLEDCEITDGKVTLTIRYAVGHTYSISFHYYMNPQPSSPDIRFEGTADGADFHSGVLTFSKDNGSVSLIVE